MEQKSDTYIIQEILKGNNESFGILVDRYKNLAFSLSMKIINNREDAEEAAQDSFIKAYKSLPTFQGTSAFKTWLFRIVYTTAISKVRKKRTNFVSFEDHRLTDQELVDTESTVGMLTVDERSIYLHQAMDKLDPDERGLLNLYYFDDLSIEEIASVTELSASNVKIKLFRCRKKLYEQLHNVLGLSKISVTN